MQNDMNDTHPRVKSSAVQLNRLRTQIKNPYLSHSDLPNLTCEQFNLPPHDTKEARPTKPSTSVMRSKKILIKRIIKGNQSLERSSKYHQTPIQKDLLKFYGIDNEIKDDLRLQVVQTLHQNLPIISPKTHSQPSRQKSQINSSTSPLQSHDFSTQHPEYEKNQFDDIIQNIQPGSPLQQHELKNSLDIYITQEPCSMHSKDSICTPPKQLTSKYFPQENSQSNFPSNNKGVQNNLKQTSKTSFDLNTINYRLRKKHDSEKIIQNISSFVSQNENIESSLSQGNILSCIKKSILPHTLPNIIPIRGNSIHLQTKYDHYQDQYSIEEYEDYPIPDNNEALRALNEVETQKKGSSFFVYPNDIIQSTIKSSNCYIQRKIPFVNQSVRIRSLSALESYQNMLKSQNKLSTCLMKSQSKNSLQEQTRRKDQKQANPDNRFSSFENHQIQGESKDIFNTLTNSREVNKQCNSITPFVRAQSSRISHKLKVSKPAADSQSPLLKALFKSFQTQDKGTFRASYNIQGGLQYCQNSFRCGK